MDTNLQKIVIRMSKLCIYGIIIHLSIFTLVFSMDGKAQHRSVDDIQVNIDLNKTLTLDKIVISIERNTDFHFSHIEQEVNTAAYSLLLDGAYTSLGDLLREISAKTDLSFKRVNDNIFIRKKEKDSEPLIEVIHPASTITGKVIDENGEPLPGATVVEKGTINGTITDVDGNFTMSVPEGAVLLVSFVGYSSREVAVSGQTHLSIQLDLDLTSLEEVVVVGFGTQKRSDIVGAISSVSSKDISNSGQNNIINALQGAAPGLRIENSALPGTSARIRVRGLNSLNANNSPLIIVDGVPFDNMRAIDPNDVESIEVLKDASAAAIYGSQAANGVILITTKRGGGVTKINASVSYALQNPMVEMDLMDGSDYLNYKREVARTNGISEEIQDLLNPTEYQQYLAGGEVDPYEMMLNRNAPMYEAQVSASGGDKVKYYIAGNYSQQEGLIRTTSFERYSLRANVEMPLTEHIKLSNGALLYQYNTSNTSDNDMGRGAMYRLSPYSVMKNNSQYTINPMPDDPLFGNPLGDAYYVSREDVNTGIFNNTVLNISIPQIEGLGVEARYSTDLSFYKFGKYAPGTTKEGYGIIVPDSDPPQTVSGSASRVNTDNRKWYFDGLITYNRSFGSHNIDLTGLYSAFSNKYERAAVSGDGFNTDDYLWHNIGVALLPIQVESAYNRRTLESQMFRANYHYDERYYVTFTVRRDGFSGFSEYQKYAMFPSGALAWRISEESFMNGVSWVDNLKLRVSYGLVGNQAISPYQTLAALTNDAGYVFGKSKASGYRVSTLETNLKWETTATANVGIDYDLFHGRLSGSVEGYHSVTRDLLVQRSIPSMMGSTTIWDNSCKVLNRGIEVNVKGVPIMTKDFQFELSANVSYNHNEILEIYGEKVDDIDNSWFIGQPIGVMYRQIAEGIWQEDEMAEAAIYGAAPGHPKIKDLPGENGEIDYKIDANDRAIVGQTVPKVLAGLNTTVSYKGLSLTVNTYGSFGAEKEMTYRYLADGRFRNFDFQNYWTPGNPSDEFPRPGTITGDDQSKYGSLFVYNADWIKIKNIILSYSVPSKVARAIGLESLDVYTSLQNYLMFTSFPFVDPETGNGIGSYPNNKQWKTGLRISF